jgi:hypothetical protein
METLNITIEDGNISIDQQCSPENFMLATSVMFSSMVLNSDQTIEELSEILQQNTLAIIEKSEIQMLEKEEIDAV